MLGNELKKKYGLLTAIAMVVGIVIGSGVFFKAEAVLKATGGNMPLGIASWAIVGVIMLICAFTFSILASKYEKVNGLVDYAEMTVGGGYAYYVGWFMAVLYNPTITSVLAWVSARYFSVLLGWDITGGSTMTIAAFFLVASYGLNTLAPILAGKFQVSTTVIKLVPLLLMAVIGTIVGLINGMTVQNFTHVVNSDITAGGGLFASVVAVAFAYEGWIIATSINAEIKDAKRNLPLALIIGSLIVVFVYIFYYIGLAGAVPTDNLMESGQAGAKLAFQNVFGTVAGSLLFVFVIISCLGTLNGLMMGNSRGMYALAARGRGPRPDIFSQIDKTTNMPANSSIIGLVLAGFWLLYFYGANLTDPWFGPFCFDTSELPIITLYAGYIPIFIMFMLKERELGPFKRLVMPVLSILGCCFMVAAAIIAHGMSVFYYMIIFALVITVGAFFSEKKESPRL
ncbi:amino acid/polyamine/organocation transporter, APC superfamily [Sporobacter termitidis DSM 10068]|uniref:Amino acid/polyamine/organocation transporter, APC superfamily n=1 Tax=Sporobacter termitidis DSM 10068 TaxID=1123282 RepID=A0A1M5Y6T4_9FIRM|nr:amino acid/polyamine/organocation transporter, APC superfamily [Sporobacter termitidis DSM 10068]